MLAIVFQLRSVASSSITPLCIFQIPLPSFEKQRRKVAPRESFAAASKKGQPPGDREFLLKVFLVELRQRGLGAVGKRLMRSPPPLDEKGQQKKAL